MHETYLYVTRNSLEKFWIHLRLLESVIMSFTVFASGDILLEQLDHIEGN